MCLKVLVEFEGQTTFKLAASPGHLLGIGDEIRREITAIELHPLDNIKLGLKAFRLLNRNHALVANLLHRLGDHLANRLVAIRRNRADLGHFFGALDLLGALLDVINGSSNALSLNLTLSSGLFSGSATVPGTKQKVSFKGALLQNVDVGYGYFLGTNQSGSVYFGD